MYLIKRFKLISNRVFKLFPNIEAEAHCDIPCGIYDPTPAKIAAKTVQRMAMQISEMQSPDLADDTAVKAYLNAVSRRIAVKETHAELCKKELQVLWSDFFKPEHLEKYPDLHDMFWRALKLASKNKQEVNAESAKELAAAVDGVANIFYAVKGDPSRFEAYKSITDKLF